MADAGEHVPHVLLQRILGEVLEHPLSTGHAEEVRTFQIRKIGVRDVRQIGRDFLRCRPKRDIGEVVPVEPPLVNRAGSVR